LIKENFNIIVNIYCDIYYHVKNNVNLIGKVFVYIIIEIGVNANNVKEIPILKSPIPQY
jgi:hypothetical protein